MPKRILVVDDDTDMQFFLRTVLEQQGFQVTTAETCCEAMAHMRSGLFDCVLLDVLLPDGNGLDVCQKIRQLKFQVYMPVVLLSSVTDPNIVNTGLQRGADAYMEKPPSPTDLPAQLTGLIDKARTQAAASGHVFQL